MYFSTVFQPDTHLSQGETDVITATRDNEVITKQRPGERRKKAGLRDEGNIGEVEKLWSFKMTSHEHFRVNESSGVFAK